MKCPSCGYNSFDHLESCKKCGSPLYGETDSQTTNDKGHKKSLDRSERSSGEPVSGDLFLDIPIRDGESQAKPVPRGSKTARRKRDSDPFTEIQDESYELFPASKDIEAGKRASDVPKDIPHSGEIPSATEKVVETPESDPFDVSVGDGEIYDSGRQSETYDREADVYSLVGFIRRAIALVIDVVLVLLIALSAYFTGLFVFYGFDFGSYDIGDMMMPLYLTLFVLSSTYFVFLHAFGGMTVGKMIMGIRLINKYGEGIGIWDAFIRWIGYYISGAFLCAGFLWALVDSESQTWHDKLAGTYVVKD